MVHIYSYQDRYMRVSLKKDQKKGMENVRMKMVNNMKDLGQITAK